MTTQTVTVLFTDLVGSTAQLSRLGEDAAEVLRREHFALLRESMGDGVREVKNLGDGLMLVAPSAADAVAAAVAIQRRFDRRNRTAAEPLSVRIGVALGDADVEESDFFGVPVVEAARLCAHADGGEILVTDVVRALAGTRGGFTFDRVGALELKGLDDPVVAHRVAWTPSAEDGEAIAVPLPSRVRGLTSTFVGRTAEREVLDGALKSVTAEGRRVVLIGGEPGIGKTTLSSAFAQHAHAAGAVVLYGRCDEDLGIPYQAWSEALGHLVRHAPEAVLAEHVDARGSELARLVPDLARRVPAPSSGTDGESERYLLFGAVTDLLARVSALAPIVLIVDDLQWADRPTVQLLRHLVTADAPARVLVVGTFRDSETTSTHPLAETLAALHREQGVERISLRGLGDDDLLALLETIAGHAMTDEGIELRDALLAETAGNPFFVGEMLRHLAETGAIYQNGDGHWVATPDLRSSGLPVSIREVIGRRVARLGPEAERVLAQAAVVGRDFDVDVLTRVTDVDEDTLLDLCDDAVHAAVLAEGDRAGRYTFAHALIEHTLYEGLSAGRRARAHRAVAEALEDLCGGDPGARVGELAYHWAHATRLDDAGKAIDYAQRAGDRALEQLAPDEALRWYAEALDLMDRTNGDDPRRRTELVLGIGAAKRDAGDPSHRETLLEAARAADSVDAVDVLVRAVLANSRGWASIIGAIDVERTEMIDRALDRIGEADSPERARLLALRCAEHLYDTRFEERLAMADEAVAVARRTGDERALVNALFYPSEAIGAPQTVPARIERTDEACRLADELDDTLGRFHSYNYRMLVALEAGDGDAVRSLAATCEALSERLGQPTLLWNAAFHRTWLATLDGDLVLAEQRAEQALGLAAGRNELDAILIYGAQVMSIRWMQGRFGEVVPLIEQAAEDNPAVPGFRAALALAVSDVDADRASALLDTELAGGFDVRLEAATLAAMVMWADAAARIGHRDAAAFLRDWLAPWSGQFATTHITLQGAVAHAVGDLERLLGRLDEADASFEQALAVHERLQAPFFVARTQAAWAALLAERGAAGDRERARELATAALTVATLRGFQGVADAATAVLGAERGAGSAR